MLLPAAGCSIPGSANVHPIPSTKSSGSTASALVSVRMVSGATGWGLAGPPAGGAALAIGTSVVRTADGHLALMDVKGTPRRAPVEALETAAAEAPFGPWTARFPLEEAVALDLASRVRQLIGLLALELAPADPGFPHVLVSYLTADLIFPPPLERRHASTSAATESQPITA